MSDVPQDVIAPDRADRADRAMTTLSGWAALALLIFSHLRSVAMNSTMWGETWARNGLIVGAGLGLMWLWGYLPIVWPKIRGWVRHGGLNSTLVAIGLIAVLIIVNTLVRRRVEAKFDLTQNQRFTLSQRSREILKRLPQPVTVTLFTNPSRPSPGVTRGMDLFKQYADASGGKFSWVAVDPFYNQVAVRSKNPMKLQSSADSTSAVLELGSKRQEITEYGEKDITGAILKMTRTTERKIGFLRGHGEAGIGAGSQDISKSIQLLTQDLQDSQWKLEAVDLFGKDARTPDPDQMAALVIAGPEREFAPEEEKHITEFLNKGGKVLLLMKGTGPGFTKFLGAWGIKGNRDLVISLRQDGLLFALADNNSHAAVRPAREARVAFRLVKSLSPITPAPAGITVTELLKSDKVGAVIHDYQPGKTDVNAQLADATPQSYPVALLAEKSIGTGDTAKKARLLVVGDAEFASDQLTRLPIFANLGFASGLINYLGEEEALVSIPPKDEKTEEVSVLPEQVALFQWIHLAYFPLGVLALSILVYLRRR